MRAPAPRTCRVRCRGDIRNIAVFYAVLYKLINISLVLVRTGESDGETGARDSRILK